MKHYLHRTLAILATAASVSAYALDPCSQTSSMSGGQTAQNGGTHNIAGGFNYEMWTESGQNASMQYTSKEGMFQFKANWNNPNDLLCRIGLYWGEGPSFDKLDGDLHCDFNYDFTGTGGGYNYIGIYGWTKKPNEIEYYIVENTFFGSTQKQDGLYWGSDYKGSYTVDGETYELRTGTRTGPSISGNSTFTQVFAVRKTPRKCGHISISEHMRQWQKNGINMSGPLYDCKFLCEVGSGSGSFDCKYGNVWIGDADNNAISFKSPASDDVFEAGDEVTITLEAETKSPVKSMDIEIDGKSIASLTSSPWTTKWTATEGKHTAKVTATLQDGSKVEASKVIKVNEPQAPYDKAFAIPGKIEAEYYDKGGAGSAYSDSDEKNQGDAKFREEEEVDIVKAGNGMAVGYTASGEWLEYTIDVEEDGEYEVSASMSNGSGSPKITLSCGSSKVSITGTGKSNDWDTYALAKASGKLSLKKGANILKMEINADNTNIDYIQIGEGTSTPSNPTDPTDPTGPTIPTTPSTPTTGNGEYFTNDSYSAYYGPSCKDGQMGTGAYYTGVYPSPFKTYLGKSDAEIQGKLDQLWTHYFKGDNNSTVYYDKGDGTAYIKDINNNDVRSEGQSYGMMICVQTGHKEEFDKLWAFAKKNMLHTSGQWDGYFKWKCNPDGSAQDANCAPDGEMYFVTALLLAANRWNEPSYNKDAQYCLQRFWKNGNGSLFNESSKIITFQPYNCSNFGDPSYDLPAFVELFAMWSTTNNDMWESCLAPTRNHLKVSCHSTSGLFADYSEFNGQPTTGGFSQNSNKYMYDAMRCAMNVGMDYYLFGHDKTTQKDMMTRLINHFEKDGYSHARFNWDGTGGSEQYTLGECGANAVGCFALMDDPANDEKVKTNLKKAWEGQLMTGQYRYYDGLVHYLAMLHLCGSFKIYKPEPTIEKKEVKEESPVKYNGQSFTKDTTILVFEDCALTEVSIVIDKSGIEESVANGNEVTIAPNPASAEFEVISEANVENVKVVDMAGRTLIVANSNIVSVSGLANGNYLVVIKTADGVSVKKLAVCK